MVEKQSRKPGRPRTFDRDDALDKVTDVFWEMGYDAADTETLSRRTGFAKPSLYKEFGSKEDMFVAALNHYREKHGRSSLDALSVVSTPGEGLKNYFLGFAKDVAGPDHPRGCLLMSVAISLRDRLPKVAKALEIMPEESTPRLQTYFAAHKEQGNLSQSFDETAAIALIRDLCAAMAVHARSGVPLEFLESKSAPFANLVLLEGYGVLA